MKTFIEQLKKKLFFRYYQKMYIRERMTEFAQNIDQLSIGQIVTDKDNRKCVITNKTINSVEVYIERKTNEGVNCKQWFDMNRFNSRFKV